MYLYGFILFMGLHKILSLVAGVAAFGKSAN